MSTSIKLKTENVQLQNDFLRLHHSFVNCHTLFDKKFANFCFGVKLNLGTVGFSKWLFLQQLLIPVLSFLNGEDLNYFVRLCTWA